MRRVLVSVISTLLSLACGASQTPVRTSGSLRFDVNLVLVPVVVTDSYDRPIRGLHKQDFRLFEDGAEQTISNFSTEEAPISIGLLFDASNSMKKKIEQSRKALSEFLRMSMPSDEVFLMQFNDRPNMLIDFTTDLERVDKTAQAIEPSGYTALYDALYLGMSQIKHGTRVRKVLLVMSDGEDNNSSYTAREIKRLIREADVRIFSISILNRSPVLETLAEESGGRAYRVKNLDDLPALAANVSVELHSHYVLGYTPANPGTDGKFRRLKVELVNPGEGVRLRVSWRRGYYAPDLGRP